LRAVEGQRAESQRDQARKKGPAHGKKAKLY
jgi:hypothetical protein